MPGTARSKYWLRRYEEQRDAGKGKLYAAEVATIIEGYHKAKLKRKKHK